MTSELRALRIEVDELRRTVHALQDCPRLPWFTGRIAVAAFVLTLALLLTRSPNTQALAAAQDDKAKELVCSALRVVGAGGKNLLTLGSDPDGGKLQVFGIDGKIRAELFVGEKQGPGAANLFDANGKRTLFLGTDEDGGIMEIYGLDGKIRTIVAVAPNQGGGLVNLFDTIEKR